MKNWSLNAKIVGILSVFVVACGVISFFGISSINKIQGSLTSIIDVFYKRTAFSFEERGLFRMLIIEERNYIIQNAEEREATKRRSDELQQRFKAIHEEWMKLSSEFARPKLEQIMQQFVIWSDNHRKIEALANRGDVKGASELSITVGRNARIALEKPLGELVDFNVKLMDESAVQAQDLAKSASTLMIVISLVAIGCGLAIAFFVLRALNATIDRVISSLRDNSQEVTSAAQQIAASSEELSQGATEQSSSLEETSASIEEMNSMVQKTTDNAVRAAEVSTLGHQSAAEGKEVVGLMVKAIEDISESNTQISDVVKIISDIENKTKVINDIVFKTQLLSFNASVEAARAGVHGKGFAVVAEEVGKLAQLSGNAAREISEMLAASVQKVNGLISVAKDKVKIGTDVAQQCGSVLDDIVSNVQQLNQMATEIASASQEQAKGIDEVTKAVGQLDQVTQENAASSEEAASAAQELSAQAESLNNMVQVLIQAIKGGEGVAGVSVSHVMSPRQSPLAVSASGAKVVHLKNTVFKKGFVDSKSFESNGSNGTSFKKAVGAEAVSEDDPRFKDV